MSLASVLEQLSVTGYERVPERPSRRDENAVIGDTTSRSIVASRNPLAAGCRKRSPFAIQITAQVSSRTTAIDDYRAASHSSPTGEVRSAPEVIVTVPWSAPKICEKRKPSAMEDPTSPSSWRPSVVPDDG